MSPLGCVGTEDGGEVNLWAVTCEKLIEEAAARGGWNRGRMRGTKKKSKVVGEREEQRRGQRSAPRGQRMRGTKENGEDRRERKLGGFGEMGICVGK
ncbi:hypothetical protein DITRI_Ditri19aG0090400 [Diplodiscus trichospermus]